jgi:hypothetical protein
LLSKRRPTTANHNEQEFSKDEKRPVKPTREGMLKALGKGQGIGNAVPVFRKSSLIGIDGGAFFVLKSGAGFSVNDIEGVQNCPNPLSIISGRIDRIINE